MPIRDGKLLHGQQYLAEDDIPAPFTQQMRDVVDADPMVGDASTEIIPHDAQNSQVRVYDLAAIQADFLATSLVSPTLISFELPNVLSSVTVTTDNNYGSGSNTITGNGFAVGTHPSLSLSPRSSANSSASIMPDIQPNITQYWTRDLVAQEVLFYTEVDPTEVAVLTKTTLLAVPISTTITITIASPGVVTWTSNPLANGDTVLFTTSGALPTGLSINTLYYVVSQATNTFRVSLTSGGTAINTSGSQSGTHSIRRGVKRWPVFKPQAHTITLIGQSLSLSADASVQQSIQKSADDLSYVYGQGTGTNLQVGLTIKTVRIPPTIHGVVAITLPNDALTDQQSSKTITVSARSHISTSNEATWPERDANSGTISGTVTARIRPVSLAATSPAAIPTSGYYLKELQGANYKYGVNRIRAVIFDFSLLA